MSRPTEKASTPSSAAMPLTTTLTIPDKANLANQTSIHEMALDHSPTQSTYDSPATPHSEHTANPFDTDIEAMVSHSSTDKAPCKGMPMSRKSDCEVWPGKDHWKRRAKADKMKRSCTCLAQLSPRNRIIAKVVIILLVVGIAVGVGFGISKPLGAPIWGKPDDNDS